MYSTTHKKVCMVYAAHSKYISEQNASTEKHPLANSGKKVFCLKAFVIQANLTERIHLLCTVTNIKKRSNTGPHTMFTSEQIASTETYPFTNRLRRIFVKKCFLFRQIWRSEFDCNN